MKLLLALAAALVTFVAALLLTTRGEETPAPPTAPAALAGVERRIAPAGLGEHLDALQRIADANGGNRAAGTAGERATADYLAGRLRAAGYRVSTQEVAVPSFRERRAPRLTAGSRTYTARTLQYSGSGTATGRVRSTAIGCTAAAFTALRDGEIALIQRGTCPFRQKVLAAQRAGAAAVLIADEAPVRGSLQRPGARIPVVAVGTDGAGLAGEEARVVVDAESSERRSPSVIAEAGAAGAARVVMAGAHLDSVDEGPGLNDNGSGVAAVLEIAEELGGRRLPDGSALRFGFWGAEEIGLVGSTRYVQDLSRAERARIAAYVNLDMVGSPGAEPAIYDGDPAIAAALRRQLGEDAPRDDLGDSSDHAPFAAANIPVGGLFTGLDKCYHRGCDTIDNVDRGVLTTSARAAGGALVELM
ncbi:M28 family peptidase [Solirubrobacter phytolaccae]|uniref:M28 family peptidase n=1 Tax=Solirubrobacter phytolaccae TaxID=1404360 RepID=A0A9X3NBU8_9ACTN|nr:M28 family peptidase [Solirubrobacter phytolaccae]MDA0182214.1 M28 family peptidase [Solirubrobacter phytolaccae]